MNETKRPLKVFLCHASTDKPKVRELYRYLRRRGINPWFDEEHLVGGQDWQVEIPKALATSDAIIICLTKNSVDKEGYIQKEIKFALDKALEMPEGRIFLIPVKFEECEVPFSLSRYQWVDLTIESGYSKMMKALKFRASQLERSTVELPKKIVEEENLSLEKAEREAAEQSAREKTEKEVSEKVRLEAEELARQKTAKEKVEREAAEKAAREKREYESAEKPVSENAKREADERARKLAEEKIRKEKEERENQVVKKEQSSQNRILEAAIEKQVSVGVSTSIFVWIKRLESKSIISVVSSIDEDVILDEDNVKSGGLEIEFPIEKGRIHPVGISLRLVAHEFTPSIQQKKIVVPPEGDSEVCTFIVTANKAGRLKLNLEVLKDQVSLVNRTLHTTAIESLKKEPSSMVLVSIPIIVFVQPKPSGISVGGHISDNVVVSGSGNVINVGKQAKKTFKISPTIVAALITAVVTIIVAIFGSPISSILSNSPTPTTIISISTKSPTPTKTHTPTAIPPTFTPTVLVPFTYIVQEGDSISILVDKFELGEKGLVNILLLNPYNEVSGVGIDPVTQILIPGEMVLIPSPGMIMPTATPIPADLPTGTLLDYIVQSGDSLGRIAEKFNSTIDAIIQENQIKSPNDLFVGQILIIPANLVTQTATRPPTSTPITPGPGTFIPTPTKKP